jgi:NADH:ubiquinone oxidoreductase subunit 5 (subunit L)/multisubunit Na+/H+ antiporter MnhA subunit/multisubunit Na+/H+ antiporter MnhB subunit
MINKLLFTAIFLPLVSMPIIVLAANFLKKKTALLTSIISIISAIILVKIHIANKLVLPIAAKINWLPSLGIDISFVVDDISLFFGYVISVMGALISLYSYFYFKNKDGFEPGRFYSYLALFMGAMLGAVFSNNILWLFIFWELTGLASFFLIGYNYQNEESKKGAVTALIVTASTGLVMFCGLIFLSLQAGTFNLQEIMATTTLSKSTLNWALALIMVGAFGKSAQFPFHFWLPKAMAAPTPVSAYLHSAAMVKLGIFVTMRFAPLFHGCELWQPLLITVGFFTMFLGALFALGSHKLKAILAYSTIAQLGFIIGYFGVATHDPNLYSDFQVINHVFYKGCLFMVVGIVISITKQNDIRKLGGLFTKIPLAAIATIIAVSGMAGLPGTTGFIAKEMVVEQVLHMHSNIKWLLLFVLIAKSIFLATCALRLVINIFFGKEKCAVNYQPSIIQQGLPLFLALGILLFGIKPNLLFGAKFIISGPEVLISILAWVFGFLLFRYFQKNSWAIDINKLFIKLEKPKDMVVNAVKNLPQKTTTWLKIDSPPYYLFIMLTFFVATSIWGFIPIFKSNLLANVRFDPVGSLETVTLAFAVMFALGVIFINFKLGRVICLSLAGFTISFFFVLSHAPDLALTQMLIEIVCLILVLIIYGRFPKNPLKPTAKSDINFRSMFASILAVMVGLVMFIYVTIVTAIPTSAPIGTFYLKNTKLLADGYNAVNTILVDFRGFDTLFEVTVLFISLLGILSIFLKQEHTTDTPFRKGKLHIEPSPIIKSTTPYIAVFMFIIAGYLFFKGHNEPGGGFIAGVTAAIALIMVSMIFGAWRVSKAIGNKLLYASAIGLIIIYIDAMTPVLWGDFFLKSQKLTFHLPVIGEIHLISPVLFDFGVMMVVFSVITKTFLAFSRFASGRKSYINYEGQDSSKDLEFNDISIEKGN